ncbi:MAG: NADH-quinone oxidoreductase subunit J, partial [Clostridia bacterium]|nr:NADH-quinone oxidoreductase subunit J [Clostridia bacterium]
MPELKLKSILQKCGVVGAGGAGFPSYGKLTDGADLLVINCIECEPLMYTDYELVREKLPEIVQGAQLVMEHTNIKRAVVAIKAYRAMTLGLADSQELAPGICVKTVPNIYPMGDEINLIYQVTGRLIKP